MTPPPSQLKISLKEQNGIQILSVMSPISADDFKIIRAGIVKLLRDGKNRIVVHFDTTEAIELSIVNELKSLNAPAKDLAGEIVVSSPSELVRQSVMAQVQSGELSVHPSIELATGHLQKKSPDSEEVLLIRKLKEQLLTQEQGEMGKVKSENETLRAENERLTDALEKMLIDRNTAFDAQAFVEKIGVLEKKIETMIAAQEEKKPAAAT